MAEPASMPPDAPSGAFDAHHPPSNDLINECVHCGFCLATCPTYAFGARRWIRRAGESI